MDSIFFADPDAQQGLLRCGGVLTQNLQISGELLSGLIEVGERANLQKGASGLHGHVGGVHLMNNASQARMPSCSVHIDRCHTCQSQSQIHGLQSMWTCGNKEKSINI